jgi:hypothetical protein
MGPPVKKMLVPWVDKTGEHDGKPIYEFRDRYSELHLKLFKQMGEPIALSDSEDGKDILVITKESRDKGMCYVIPKRLG